MRRTSVWILAALAVTLALPAVATAAGPPDDRGRAEAALQRVKDLKRGVGVRTGRELTHALRELALHKRDLDAAGRREASSLLARPTDSNDGDFYGVPFMPDVRTHCPAASILCFHWVHDAASADAPALTDGDADTVPDYVEQMAAAFGEVYACENGAGPLDCAQGFSPGLDWQDPISDGTAGGNGSGKLDVYIHDLTDNLYGYATTETCVSASSCAGYMVMNNDYGPFVTGSVDATEAMQVTAAHEYNHILQFGYDVAQDDWLFEATATWAEEKVYPGINDYLNYLPTWVAETGVPLTTFDSGSVKVYGSAVWNHWLSGRYGDDVVLDAWEASTDGGGGPIATGSYDTAIVGNGGTGFSNEFNQFSAAAAEWRVPGAGFPDTYPDVPRGGGLTIDGGGTTIQLDHTTFALRNVVPPSSSATLTLQATLPAGLRGAIALVGRTGASQTAGTVTRQIQHVTNGGSASVSLPNAHTYGRITAVLVNSDDSRNGFVNNDWKWTRDNENFSNVRVTSAAGPPAPGVTTAAASAVATTTATLNGSVDPNGTATTYYFEYGPTTAYGAQVPATPASAGSGGNPVSQSQAVAGLSRGTTYHYRIVAESAGGIAYGGDQTFTTLDPPEVVTLPASEVGLSSAKLNATVDPNGKATTYRFEYGTTTAYGSQVPLSGSTAGNGSVPVTLGVVASGLEPSTTYHFRIVAQNADGLAVGEDRTFTTAAPPPPASEAPTAAGTTDTSGTTSPTGGTVTTAGTEVTTAFAMRLALTPVRLRTALRRGLRGRVTCGRSCRVTARLKISKTLAKRLRLRSRTVASGRASASGAASTALAMRFTRAARRALARSRSVRFTMTVVATDSTGQKRTLVRRITLRR